MVSAPIPNGLTPAGEYWPGSPAGVRMYGPNRKGIGAMVVWVRLNSGPRLCNVLRKYWYRTPAGSRVPRLIVADIATGEKHRVRLARILPRRFPGFRLI